MDFLKGKKELITLAVGFLGSLLATLGFADWVPLLNKLQAAIAAGDATAIVGAFFSLVLFAAAFFRRIAENRKNAVMAGKAP